jgi:hypothetical protein
MDDTTSTETMTVTVRDRASEHPWGSGFTTPITKTVTISAFCRICGSRRGQPRGLNSCDDGAFYWIQVWENPCGHLDRYVDVLKEASERAGHPSAPASTGGVDR